MEGTDPVAVASNGVAPPGPPADWETTDPGADDPITDEELTALALAADPDQPLDGDAVPLSVYLSQLPGLGPVSGLLPGWYMPPAMASRGSKWRTSIILAIIVAFLMIEAWGLCSTYGQVVLA
jgi:hypothetical protein